MSQSKGGRAAILLILVGGVGVGALAYYVKSTPQATRVPDDLRIAQEDKRRPSTAPPTVEVDPPRRVEPKRAEGETVRLPVFGDEISDMELAKRQTLVPDGGDPMRFVALKVAEAAHIDGARVLGIDVRDHVAFVGYNDAVQKGMGSMEEGMFLHALQVGFGQFTDVDRVAVESEGAPLQSGHVDLSQPLPVIRPGEKSSREPDSTRGEP